MRSYISLFFFFLLILTLKYIFHCVENPSLFLASNNKVIYRLLFSLKKSEKEKREVNIEYYYASKTKSIALIGISAMSSSSTPTPYLQTSGMLSKEQLLHLFNRFSFLTSQPGTFSLPFTFYLFFYCHFFSWQNNLSLFVFVRCKEKGCWCCGRQKGKFFLFHYFILCSLFYAFYIHSILKCVTSWNVILSSCWYLGSG